MSSSLTKSMQENLITNPVVGELAQSGNSQPIKFRSTIASSNVQSGSIQRRSLNTLHFNALQNAVSNLARIDDFDLEELGYGFFSDVFKATHKQNGKVMVLKRNKNTNTKLNILREVQLMNRLSHPNILRFKGVCVHNGQLHALTEFINGGDLDQLVTKKDVILSWKQRIQLALDVARGMKYLHSLGIFHRDLSAKNCLVSVVGGKKGKKKYGCVVADLGLAEKIPTSPEDEEKLSIVGTPYIMAPEVLREKPYNEKADVFSFGLLICQLIALVSSDPEELPRSSDFGLARDLFSKMVNAPPAPGCPPETSFPPPKNFLQLAYDCCQMEPKSRPSFEEIVVQLEGLVASMKCKHVRRSSSFKGCKNANQLHVLPKEDGVPAKRRQGISASATSSPLKDTHLTVMSPHKEKRKRHTSTPVRLSRSFSDISRELLSHAANMVASSIPTFDDDVNEEQNSYENPFSALELLEGGQRKFTDEPSRALLEMTFDLATSDSLKTSWRHRSYSFKKQRRPKSTIATDSSFQSEHSNHSPPSHLYLSSPVHKFNDLDSRSATHSPQGSTPEETLTRCHECNYQRAMHRAMILSPLGNSLTSWWCSRQRSTSKTNTKNERNSLATVMSLLSWHSRGLRRSISLPDLSQTNILFTDSSPRDSRPSNVADRRPQRSKTSLDVFANSSAGKTIVEESENELVATDSSSQQSSYVLTQDAPSVQPEHTSVVEPGSLSGSEEATDACSKIQTADVNLNVIFNKVEITSKVSPHLDSVNETNCSGESVQEIPHEKNENFNSSAPLSTSFSSSSSSESCTNSFLMTLHSGEVTQGRRKNNCDRMVNSVDNLNNNNPVSHGIGDNLVSSKFCNRDSGYEEDNHLHVLSPSSEFTKHHVTWNIPEEPVIIPPSSPSVPGRCGMHTNVANWNSNNNALTSDYT